MAVDLDPIRQRRDAYRDASARMLRTGEPDSDRAREHPAALVGLADAAIAAAGDVEYLVAEVTNLRRQNERLRGQNDVVFRGIEASTKALNDANAATARGLDDVKRLTTAGERFKQERDEARAEVARLRAELEGTNAALDDIAADIRRT